MHRSRTLRNAFGLLLLAITLLLVIGLLFDRLHQRYEDISQDVVQSVQPLATPPGIYSEVVWLTDDQIAFLYEASDDSSGWNYQIALYTLTTQQWHTLTIPQPSQCRVASPQHIQRLPDGNLGFVYSCLVDLSYGGLSDDFRSLYRWDIYTGHLEIVQQYPANFKAGSFSLAPDGSAVIQEQMVGNGLNNQLYRVRPHMPLERLFASWQRVATPVWSPDGQTIAFIGTAVYTATQPLHPSLGFDSITQLYDYPWDLYLTEADGEQPQLLLEGIQWAVIKNWAPQHNTITFAGSYQGQGGIWLLTTTTQQVVRVWPDMTDSDWAPDGHRMVILQRGSEDDRREKRPVIVDVVLPNQ